MEAKDTVMPGHYSSEEFTHLNKQAEISFKAGQQEEYKKWIKSCMGAGMLISEPKQLVNLYQSGRREVVEWIRENLYDATGRRSVCGIFAIPDYKLKAKLRDWFKNAPELLKEWGLSDVNDNTNGR